MFIQWSKTEVRSPQVFLRFLQRKHDHLTLIKSYWGLYSHKLLLEVRLNYKNSYFKKTKMARCNHFGYKFISSHSVGGLKPNRPSCKRGTARKVYS